jgi:hypothetical protein
VGVGTIKGVRFLNQWGRKFPEFMGHEHNGLSEFRRVVGCVTVKGVAWWSCRFVN